MGVPGLVTHLRPYATPEVTGNGISMLPRGGQYRSHRVIIDGPALAYYVYYKDLERSAAVTCPPAVNLPNLHLGSAVLTWLDQCQAAGLKMYEYSYMCKSALGEKGRGDPIAPPQNLSRQKTCG